MKLRLLLTYWRTHALLWRVKRGYRKAERNARLFLKGVVGLHLQDWLANVYNPPRE